MSRFFVPWLGAMVVIGLATLLIGVIVLRSPNTRANLGEEVKPGYSRTVLALMDSLDSPENPWSESMDSGDTLGALQPGRQVYLNAGCGTCHGLEAQGGPVGPPLAGAIPEIVVRMVRDGLGGMPAYLTAHISDTDMDALTTYFQQMDAPEPSAQELAALKRLTFTPSVPTDVLLKGKVALRKSCHGCHAPPSKDEILSVFASDVDVTALVAQMVQETPLSVENAEYIAYYMMAIRHGAEPVQAP